MRKKRNIVLEKLHIDSYAAEGKSLGKTDGKVVFVEGTVPGDVVDVRLHKNKKDWAEGSPVAFHEYSKERVDPFCSHFGVCGGCQWQMLPYEKQLQYKQEQVEQTLRRIGHVDLPVLLPIVGAAQTRYYRNKIEYTFSNRRFLLEHELRNPRISAEEDVAGFHVKGIFDKIIDVKECYLQREPSNEIRLAIKEFAKEHKYPFYDIRNHSGMLRTMQLRVCDSGEVMVNIVFALNDEEKIAELLKYIQGRFPSITTLLYTINKKWNDSFHDLSPVAFTGNGFVFETLLGANGETFRFKIGPKSFFQTNTRQAEQLYRITRDFAQLTGRETVYDLYCGTGSIGIFLSPLAHKIVGIELIEAAIDDARENATLNNVHSAEFYAGDVVDICNDQFISEHGKPDVIVTDPPRAGMHAKLVQKILDIKSPVIVYVSCNPATQARDIGLLSEKYLVAKIQPVDMFPHTHHIECVAKLTLR